MLLWTSSPISGESFDQMASEKHWQKHSNGHLEFVDLAPMSSLSSCFSLFSWIIYLFVPFTIHDLQGSTGIYWPLMFALFFKKLSPLLAALGEPLIAPSCFEALSLGTHAGSSGGPLTQTDWDRHWLSVFKQLSMICTMVLSYEKKWPSENRVYHVVFFLLAILGVVSLPFGPIWTVLWRPQSRLGGRTATLPRATDLVKISGGQRCCLDSGDSVKCVLFTLKTASSIRQCDLVYKMCWMDSWHLGITIVEQENGRREESNETISTGQMKGTCDRPRKNKPTTENWTSQHPFLEQVCKGVRKACMFCKQVYLESGQKTIARTTWKRGRN